MSTQALQRVRVAVHEGARTRKEIRLITELDEDIVNLCVDLLIENKELEISELKGACTIGGCNTCTEDSTCHPREEQSGPVPISITKAPE